MLIEKPCYDCIQERTRSLLRSWATSIFHFLASCVDYPLNESHIKRILAGNSGHRSDEDDEEMSQRIPKMNKIHNDI